jgi:hypothetical protein
MRTLPSGGLAASTPDERQVIKAELTSVERRLGPTCDDAVAEYEQTKQTVLLGATAAAALTPPAPVVIPQAPTYTHCFETGNGFNCSTY